MESSLDAGLFFMVFFISFIFFYVTTCLPMYMLGRKADLDYAFWAFIPILNSILLLDIIKERRLSIILLFIPFVNVIFAIYWVYKLFVVFDRPAILYLILYMFIPFAAVVILFYMAFSSTVRYNSTV